MPDKPKRLRPHTTVRGRIVYERPVHHFNEKDLLRVFKRVIERDADETYIAWLVDLFFLMFQAAFAALFQYYKETLPAAIGEFIIRVLSGIIQLLESLGVAGYNFITQAIAKAFGLLTIKTESKEVPNGGVEG